MTLFIPTFFVATASTLFTLSREMILFFFAPQFFIDVTSIIRLFSILGTLLLIKFIFFFVKQFFLAITTNIYFVFHFCRTFDDNFFPSFSSFVR